ncbi:MAG: S41 family peptidase [Bacteroidales bacterium]
MIYKDLDRWTYVTDDAEATMKDFAGVTTTFGYSLALGKFSNTGELFAIIKYVDLDTPTQQCPAGKAGLKRGDIILSFANGPITEKNYTDLFYAKAISIQLGKDENKVISPVGNPISLTAVEMYEDPVNAYTVLESNHVKIGYLAYTGFLAESHKKLDKVFTGFKDAGVTEVILDLRYNPGGNAVTPPYLASFLAPSANVLKGDVFLTEQWNDLYMAYYNQKGRDMNVYFNKANVANLNLKRIFILTTSGSASASEATISGLMPYIQVIKIGETTHGKYMDDGKTLDPLIKNWLLSEVIYKFVNKDGFTDFKDGMAPDYPITDDLFAALPFGDKNDPMIAKAISLITGVRSKATTPTSSFVEGRDFTMLPKLTEDLQKDYGNTQLINLRLR